MSYRYIVGADTFMQAVRSHKYCIDADIELAEKFVETSQMGDFVNYAKGMFVRVNINEQE